MRQWFLLHFNRIDLLLAHSSSVYPAVLLLCEAKEISIKAAAFFNPAGHRRIMAMRPAWFTEGSVKVYQNKLGRMVFKVFGKSFIKVTNSVTVKPESMNNVMLSAQTMRYSNYKEVSFFSLHLSLERALTSSLDCWQTAWKVFDTTEGERHTYSLGIQWKWSSSREGNILRNGRYYGCKREQYAKIWQKRKNR